MQTDQTIVDTHTIHEFRSYNEENEQKFTIRLPEKSSWSDIYMVKAQ